MLYKKKLVLNGTDLCRNCKFGFILKADTTVGVHIQAIPSESPCEIDIVITSCTHIFFHSKPYLVDLEDVMVVALPGFSCLKIGKASKSRYV